MADKIKRALLPVFLLLAVWFAVDFWCCPIKFIFGINCPGCGMTRSMMALLRLDLGASFYWHPMLLPTGAALIFYAGFTLAKKEKAAMYVVWAWAVLMMGCWIVRMYLYFPNAPMDFDSSSLLGKVLSMIHIL